MLSRTSSVLIGLTILALLSSCSEGSDTMTTSRSDTSTSLIANAQSTVSSVSTQTIQKSVSYGTPSGKVATTFSLSLSADGVITALEASTSSRDHEDREYAERFTRGATRSIIGKKLSSLSLDAVGGASLTTEAFRESVIGSL